jgi:hypothetical protein
MGDTKKPLSSDDAEAIEREIRSSRKFSMSDAIGQMGGQGMLKGASPVPPIEQTALSIANYLDAHLEDAGGVLAQVVLRRIKASDILIAHFDQPAAVLAEYVSRVLNTEMLLQDLVREVDAEWGRALGERPHFDREGRAPDPNDPYTLASVSKALAQLVVGHKEEA